MSGAVGIGAYPLGYRADESFNPADEQLIESILFALEALHGEATTFALASHIQSTMRRIEPVLARMHEDGLLKFEVVRPGEHDGIEWRRTKAGISMAAAIEARQRARRR
jgi:hypothetical protein